MPVGTHPVFRPPAEWNSLIIRVMDGCPWNRCAFCGMYRGVSFRTFDDDVVRREIRRWAVQEPDARRVFLADGDVMALPFDTLRHLLAWLREDLPRLRRVSLYANGRSILAKREAQLAELRAAGLHTLYLGLESGDAETLKVQRKCESADEMCDAVRRAQGVGLRVSVMVLVGLAGRRASRRHAEATARVLNRMQPRLLSALRVIPVPGTELHRRVEAGEFAMCTEWEAVHELRTMISLLDLDRTVFRADHSSNVVPLEGRFPRDRARLLATLDRWLDDGDLDRTSPGPMPRWL